MTTAAKIRWGLLVAVLACGAALAVWPKLDAPAQPKHWRVEVKASYPHDPEAFTQGLAFHEGRLYEGTGQYGRSSIRRIALPSGEIEAMQPLSALYFGEGITIFDGKLHQLTWVNQVGFVYDLETFERVATFRYEGEGWGLTHDGKHLIMSNGSERIVFLDPSTYEVVRTIRVRSEGRPVVRLNELEYVDGEIWANIWYEDRIARIDPRDGEVVGWIDASRVYPRSERGREDVLNGIAYDPKSRRLIITGKNWPRLYEVEVVPL
ncbi:MAG: glutaminyl-peptide cyclotransferase [Gammaproteobacteria bacterium]|nr:glutamine cyclotransferase [Gammaproteobacteria bacterium]